jgi:hypothetical protein
MGKEEQIETNVEIDPKFGRSGEIWDGYAGVQER